MNFKILASFVGLVVLSLNVARAQPAVPVTQNVSTYMFDQYQTGINPNETILTPANVTSSTFGQLFSCPIDDQAYAQPLYLSNITVNGKKHNVAYVATMHDSLYAFDADTGGTALWQDSFISGDTFSMPNLPSGTITPVPIADLPGSGSSDVSGPDVGIESTPVIDTTSGTIYVVAKTKETGRGDGNIHYVQRLYALDVTTGAEKFGSPEVIGDTTCNNPNPSTGTSTYDFNLTTVPQTPSAVDTTGNGDNNVGGSVYFNALRNLQRCSLTLLNGVVYVAWASHGDNRPYHGWLVGYNATTLAPIPNMVFCDTPNGSQGGIWCSGAGPTVDNNGNLFIATANAGASYCANQTPGNVAESFLKFNPANGLSVNAAGFDFWSPGQAPSLGNADSGVGSGGLTLMDVPGPTAGTTAHICMGGSKNNDIYVVNRDNMGHFIASTSSDNDIQTIVTGRQYYMASPVFYNGYLFLDGGDIQGYTFNSATTQFTPSGSASYGFTSRGGGFVISANGTSNGIIWSYAFGVLEAIRPESIAGPGAGTGVASFFNTALGDRSTVKFTHPIVINGKVYGANVTAFLGYGLLNATLPTVSVAVTGPVAVNGLSTGQFTFTRAGSTLGNLLVTYSVAGTAQSGTDDVPLSGTVTIPNGATSATVTVTANAGAQNNATVIATVSANANYQVGTAQTASVVIESAAYSTSAATNLGQFTLPGTPGNPITLTAPALPGNPSGVIYTWYFNGAAVSTGTSNMFTASNGQAGIYAVYAYAPGNGATGNATWSFPTVSSDTPVLPPWGYGVLVLTLLVAAWRGLRKPAFPSPS